MRIDRTLLNDLSYKDFCEAGDNLCDGLGDLLAERLLYYLSGIISSSDPERDCTNLAHGLLGQRMSPVRLESFILCWAEVVHQNPIIVLVPHRAHDNTNIDLKHCRGRKKENKRRALEIILALPVPVTLRCKVVICHCREKLIAIIFLLRCLFRRRRSLRSGGGCSTGEAQCHLAFCATLAMRWCQNAIVVLILGLWKRWHRRPAVDGG